MKNKSKDSVRSYRCFVRFSSGDWHRADFQYTFDVPSPVPVSVSRNFRFVNSELRRLDLVRDMILLRYVGYMVKLDSSSYDFFFDDCNFVWSNNLLSRVLCTMTCKVDFMYANPDRGCDCSCEGVLTVKLLEV